MLRSLVGSEMCIRDRSLSEQLELPLADIHVYLGELRAAGVILEANPASSDEEPAYVPARGPDAISVATVVEALEGTEHACAYLPESDETGDLRSILREFNRSIESSDANRLLRDIPTGKSS